MPPLTAMGAWKSVDPATVVVTAAKDNNEDAAAADDDDDVDDGRAAVKDDVRIASASCGTNFKTKLTPYQSDLQSDRPTQ